MNAILRGYETNLADRKRESNFRFFNHFILPISISIDNSNVFFKNNLFYRTALNETDLVSYQYTDRDRSEMCFKSCISNY